MLESPLLKDYPEAVRTRALVHLGKVGTARSFLDADQGLALLDSGVRDGYPPAMRSMAILLVQGDHIAIDSKRAIRLLEQAWELGDVESANTLANIYCNGFGDVPQDFQEGLKYARLAAEKGNTDSMVILALAYEFGDGVEADKEEALRWFERAGRAGDRYSITILCRRYSDLEPTFENIAKRDEWIDRRDHPEKYQN